MVSAEEEKELTLIDHLVELRDRILKCVVGIVVIFLALFYWANDIYNYVALPLIQALPEGSTMIAIDPTSPFFSPFKLTFYVAFLLAAPYVLYQLWSFVAPGLYKNEKAVAIPLFISSVILFYAGIGFARYVLFGIVFGFFISVAPDGIQVAPDISSFLNFALTIFFAFGVAFEIPVAVFLCIWAGLAEPESLSEKRPYVVVGCFIAAMLLTPPDPFTQSMLALPMWALFELGILAGRFMRKKQSEEDTI
jgi:sec-independent protein translocase protein TatC